MPFKLKSPYKIQTTPIYMVDEENDVLGRAKTYESIVKGDPMPEPGLPESFNVLMHELRGLGLDVRLEE